MNEDNSHFKTFASSLEGAIARHGSTSDANERQRLQMTQLVALENKFRLFLARSTNYGPLVYRNFVKFICDEQKNILDARPFFRERQGVFAAQISKALKARNYKALYGFGINYQFILFTMRQKNWGKKSPLTKMASDIADLRKEIVTINLPLAINRAQLFYSRTPRSHITRMDFVGIAAAGMMSGIDKYTPDKKTGVNTRQFKSTVLGRMGGDFISCFSETVLHFYPADKRKLYRANKLNGRNVGAIDYEKLAEGVNIVAAMPKEGEDIPREVENPTTADEIASLMSGASTVSSDSSLPSDPDAPAPIERFSAPEATRPDVQAEERDAMRQLLKALPVLTVIQHKLLRLRGIRIF